MTSKLIQTIGLGVIAATGSAFAGDEVTYSNALLGSQGGGDWCKAIEDVGTVYKKKKKKNPWIQRVEFFGRAHYQWGYTDGDVNGFDFSGDGGELRRLRFGASVEFLDGFKIGARANLEKGGWRDDSLGYNGWDELYIEREFGDVLGLEDVAVTYGLLKLGFGGEEYKSSKKIKTIERSFLNNYYAGDRVTGGRIEFSKGDVDFLLGIFTTDGNDESLGQWDGGTIFQFGAEFEALGGDFLVQAVYRDQNDAEPNETVAYDWAGSLTYETDLGPVDLFVNATYGSDQNGDLYGVVIMPSMDLIEDKLEAVVRYQWAHSTGDRIRLQNRNTRNVYRMDGFGDFRGDDHHSIYAGLNYFICDHNLKLMAGVEYETLDGPIADYDATTVWGAVRFYF